MTGDQSVTEWIEELRDGQPEAARRLWERYFDRLVAIARNKLGSFPRRVADEEDIALSAFGSLCQGVAAGRFERLRHRDDLWALLLTITATKAIDQIRHQSRQKRGGNKVRGDSVFENDDAAARGIDQVVGQEPTPAFLAEIDEQYGRLLAGLRDDSLRTIVQHKLAGYTHDEIATDMGISVHSVGRKLRMIRMAWSRELVT